MEPSLFSGVLLVGGCGTNGKKVVDGNKDKPLITTEPEDAGGSIQHGDGYGFTEFNLEIDVDEVETIDIDYEVKKFAEAEYENKLENFYLYDQEAMDAIHELFMEIRITNVMPEEEVIQKIIQFLRVDHYSRFELEVDFDDGTKLDINDVK